MADSLSISKVTYHARSNSLPSKSHPLIVSVEDHLCRLRASETTSLSSSFICNNLGNLRELHEDLNNLIQLPSVQQSLSHDQCEKSEDEVLDGSFKMLDVCSTAIEVLQHLKESVQELESSLRRKRGGEFDLPYDVSSYMVSRKEVKKLALKCIKNLVKFETNCSSTLSDKAINLVSTLRKVEPISFLVLRSVLSYLSGTNEKSKQRGWSLVSHFVQPKRISCDTEKGKGAHELEGIDSALYALIQRSCKDINAVAVQNVLKQLQTLEWAIKDLEVELEAVYRCLVKTRVSLLNALNY